MNQSFYLSPRRFTFVVASVALLTLPAFASSGATLPPGFTETEFGGSLSGQPTAMAFSPDGRLFVCLQTGQLRVIKNGALLATPFLSLSVDSSGERGLLGIAFDPNFFTNHYVYVYYTVPTSPAHNRVSRFTAAGDVAAPGTGRRSRTRPRRLSAADSLRLTIWNRPLLSASLPVPIPHS